LATYEIRTLKNRGRLSLIAKVECPNDVSAIISARQFMRIGETVEVRRDEKLVYRVAPIYR